MKKILYSIAITIFLSANIHAQTPDTGKWTNVLNPAGLNQSYNDMVFVTDTIGYIFGNLSPSTDDIEVTNDSGDDFLALPFPNPTDTIHLDTNGHPYVVYNHYSAIASVADMAWPAPNTGFVVGATGRDNYGHNPAQTILVTQDGGSNWSQYYPTDNDSVITKADTAINKNTTPPDTTITPADTVVNPELWNNIYFPNTTVGYASAASSDGTNYIAKTTDGGKTWTDVYRSDTLSFGRLHFIDANNGIFIAQGITLHIGYTTNGGKGFLLTNIGTAAQGNFLHWNNDSSWLVGADSVYRSVDSGQQWTCVVANDSAAVAGTATVGAFFGDTGFVFLGIDPTVLMTTNAGISWTSSRLPNNINGTSADSVTPLAASMPDQYDCYLLVYDNNAVADGLMKIAFGKPTSGGGGNGVVQTEAVPVIPFAAVYGTDAITFTMAPAPETRSIQILDVLGRTCASLMIAPASSSGQLATNVLRPGTYFAQLGESVVKFVIP